MSEAWRQIGTPVHHGIILIGDHASNAVPADIDLGMDPGLFDDHIAWDIGVTAVAELLVASGKVDAAILGGVSRLVVDCNRDKHSPGIIPIVSDGHAIPGNALDHGAHRERLERIYFPYHSHISATLAATRPAMILSLHSFTPSLAIHPDEARPWHVGVLYNEDDRLARVAIPAFAALGLTVGDQLPYSGKLLNHTMNVHGEANRIPYLGIEMRQDRVSDAAGQAHLAEIIGQILVECRHHLAQAPTFRQ